MFIACLLRFHSSKAYNPGEPLRSVITKSKTLKAGILRYHTEKAFGSANELAVLKACLAYSSGVRMAFPFPLPKIMLVVALD